MRVAVIAPGYAPDIGGVETVVTQVSRAVSRLGVDVEVWAPQPGLTSTECHADGAVVVRRFPASRSAHYSVSTALWCHVWAHAAEFDVVHAHSYHAAAALALTRPGTWPPYVLSPHYHGGGHTTAARVLHVAHRPLGRRLVHRAQQVIAVSAAERDLIERDFAGLRRRPTVIHHGTDVTAATDAKPFGSLPPTALVVGRLERYKRVDSVIDAFDRIAGAGLLAIAGDGPDRGRLEAKIDRARRRDDIRLLGRVSDDDLARWMRSANVVVNMSEHEAFGLVALEGAAAGARVLLSDLPAHREVVGLAGGAVTVLPDRNGSLEAGLAGALAGVRRQPVAVRAWADVAADHLAVYEVAASDRARIGAGRR